MTKKVKRLFNDFQPKHYLLDLDIDDEKMTFSGMVTITGHKAGRPSQRLTFHQKSLKITKASIIKHGKSVDAEIEIDRFNKHDSLDEIRLHAKSTLYPGNYTVQMHFMGKITRNMNGLYPCFFKQKGKENKLFATQFESHHAREVFPCVDEPEAKATFQLGITTRPFWTVISNTPVESSIKQGSKLKTMFHPTPHMSTYLLAFVAGDVEFIEGTSAGGVKVRTFATPENVGRTKFALDVAIKCLDFYNDYFGIDYPLEKCDLIALPDFASGAMENWGCITFREQTLLVDEKKSTLANKQYVALVIAHELAHQWFGNLVTMRWWTDLWLNEGFASWIEYMAINHIFPEWEVWTQFIVDEQQPALKLDALDNTHPIEVPVNHPDEIRTIFDAISYNKGASVIHMLHGYLGERDFQNGLRHYLETHKYSNTVTTDLWDSLEQISGKAVRKFMHSWTSTPGFPLVNATFEDNGAILKQQRFFADSKMAKDNKQLWPVPTLAHAPKLPAVMENRKLDVNEQFDTVIKLNRDQGGFYRVVYNASHLQRLGHQIDTGHLSAVDRLGVLNDMFEASKAGMADTVDALFFLEHFASEDQYPVWDSVAGLLGSTRLIMDDEELRQSMKPFIIHLTKKQLKRLGWESKKSDTHFDKLLRPIILGLNASADEPTVVEKCLELFKHVENMGEVPKPLKTPNAPDRVRRGLEVDPDLRGVVFSTAARLGGKAEFEKLVKMHHKATLTEEKTTLLAAITDFKQPELIEKALGLIKSEEVRMQDVSYWVAYSLLNRFSRKRTWEWLKENWQWLEKNLGTDMAFHRMPIYVARVFSDPWFIKEYKEFFTSRMAPGLERSYKQGLEILETQVDWKKRALKEVKTFFNQYQPK